MPSSQASTLQRQRQWLCHCHRSACTDTTWALALALPPPRATTLAVLALALALLAPNVINAAAAAAAGGTLPDQGASWLEHALILKNTSLRGCPTIWLRLPFLCGSDLASACRASCIADSACLCSCYC